MRRYWTGTTEQAMPRAAPAVWPYDHRTMAQIIALESVAQYKDGEWHNAFWAHLGRYGKIKPTRWRNGRWQVETSISNRCFIYGSIQPDFTNAGV